MVVDFCHHLSDNYMYVDLSDLYVDLSGNFVFIYMALIGQDYVFCAWQTDLIQRSACGSFHKNS